MTLCCFKKNSQPYPYIVKNHEIQFRGDVLEFISCIYKILCIKISGFACLLLSPYSDLLECSNTFCLQSWLVKYLFNPGIIVLVLR